MPTVATMQQNFYATVIAATSAAIKAKTGNALTGILATLQGMTPNNAV